MFLNVCYIIYNIIHSNHIFALNKVHDKHKINTNNSDFTVFYTVCFLSACLGLPITQQHTTLVAHYFLNSILWHIKRQTCKIL